MAWRHRTRLIGTLLSFFFLPPVKWAFMLLQAGMTCIEV